MNRWRNFDWEAAAGIVAAVGALVLHLLDVADQGVLLSVILVILALYMIRDLRREQREERIAEQLPQILVVIEKLRLGITPADAVLAGPRGLRTESERFARRARGDMVWFNVCLLMFEPQILFDVLLRPAIENDGCPFGAIPARSERARTVGTKRDAEGVRLSGTGKGPRAALVHA